MNLYATSPDPKECAKFLDTKRLCWCGIKESAQLISTAIWELWRIETPVKPTHANHPVSLWVRERPENLSWTLRYMGACCKEYFNRKEKRYSVNTVTADELHWRFYHISAIAYKDWGTLKHPKHFCNHAANHKMGIDYTQYDVHRAYKLYLAYRWTHTDKVAPRWD